MKRVALLLLLVFSIVAAPAFAQTDVFLLGFTGFDYQDPNPDPGNYLAIGEGYRAVGFVTSFGDLLAPVTDMVANEYTFHLYDLVVQTRFYDGAMIEVTFADAGRVRYFEDPKSGGTAAQYGVNPPNGTAPPTFIDGTLVLGGRVDNFVVTYDYTFNEGSFVGNVAFDEGSLIGTIPPERRDGWTLGGLSGAPNNTVPQGYDHQISGECRIPGPTPATHRTWGAVKALYR